MSTKRGGPTWVGLTDVVDPQNVLYYGDGGTGKTSHMAAMAKLGPVLFVNAEGGMKRRPLERLGIPVENIQVWPPPGQPITYDGLSELHAQLLRDLEEDPTSWAGVGWDSLTEIHKMLLESASQKAYRRAVRDGKDRADFGEFFIAVEDYGVMTEQVRRLFRRFRDLPCHFTVSCLQRRDKDDDGKVKYGPSVTPALATDVFGWMDLVVYTDVRETPAGEDYRGQFHPVGKFRAKDRYGVFPTRLPTPSFDRIVDYVEGDLDVENDPVVEKWRQVAATHVPPTGEDDESDNDNDTDMED